MLFIISLLSGAVFEVMSAYIDLNMTNSYASFLRLCLLYVENRQVLDVHANVWYQHLTTSASPCGCMLGPRRPGWHDDGPYHVRPSWNAAKSKRHQWKYSGTSTYGTLYLRKIRVTESNSPKNCALFTENFRHTEIFQTGAVRKHL